MFSNQNTDTTSSSEQTAKFRALELLREALKVIDVAEMPLEIGARLQHVICSVDQLRD